MLLGPEIIDMRTCHGPSKYATGEHYSFFLTDVCRLNERLGSSTNTAGNHTLNAKRPTEHSVEKSSVPSFNGIKITVQHGEKFSFPVY